jgi:hypothetical protein
MGDMPAGSVGIPAMYETNGKQYLLISATQGAARGGGAAPPAREGAPAAPPAGPEEVRSYVAFALK